MASVSLESLRALLQQPAPPSRIFVAEAAGLAGYAALTLDYALWSGAQFGHLDCMFVRPAHRGHGVGRALFDAVAQAAQLAGASRLEWQTPLWNENGRVFYSRMGADSSPKHRFWKALAPEADGGR